MGNENEIRNLNEGEFEKVSGGSDKDTELKKIVDEISRKAQNDIPETKYKCIKCGTPTSLRRRHPCRPLRCSKCGGYCIPCGTDEYDRGDKHEKRKQS